MICVSTIHSHDRQRDSIDFLIHIEGIYIGHTADIINDRHDARFQVGTIDVVLAAESSDQLLRMKSLRRDGRPDECVHQRLHNLVTAEFHV